MEELSSSINLDKQKQSTPLNKLAIVATVLSGVTIIAGVIALIVVNNNFKAQVTTLKTENAALIKTVKAVTVKQSSIESDIHSLKISTVFQRIAHTVEGALVTDDFVVNRINIYTEDADTKLTGINIDLENQPRMALAYKQSGQYNISDRELRAKIKPIVNQVEEYYKKFPDTLDWTSSTPVNITVKNYSIATVQNSEVKLVGEK
ncbi:hypothetical protein [Paenibacillus polymyxa]|uniref:Uncharacterized protein n=1 Tax=Paenibacillus polymyxa TaxID=1406 RepID=A0AAE9L9D2_PAEPO|nr:hypothetical protein [Paenibacillus polymyxa]URJ51246.1 hypothetical protein MF626_000653 [Paenibacillus polymyxa]